MAIMKMDLNSADTFASRHIGPRAGDRKKMLETIAVESLDELIEQTIPKDIRLTEALDLPQGISEYRLLQELKRFASENQVFTSYLGLGYYNCIVPSAILRNIFENPGWYTQYTPYQSEISQGRLEALLNFQTMVMDLTAMEVANASLLDEGTAAAEAMTMLYRLRNKDLVTADANVFFVSESCLPQTIEILKTRAQPLGIKLAIGDHQDFEFDGMGNGPTTYRGADHQCFKDVLVMRGKQNPTNQYDTLEIVEVTPRAQVEYAPDHPMFAGGELGQCNPGA